MMIDKLAQGSGRACEWSAGGMKSDGGSVVFRLGDDRSIAPACAAIDPLGTCAWSHSPERSVSVASRCASELLLLERQRFLSRETESRRWLGIDA
jgi:hypothetical protein